MNDQEEIIEMRREIADLKQRCFALEKAVLLGTLISIKLSAAFHLADPKARLDAMAEVHRLIEESTSLINPRPAEEVDGK